MHPLHIIEILFYIFTLNGDGYQLSGLNVDGQHGLGGRDKLNGQDGLHRLEGLNIQSLLKAQNRLNDHNGQNGLVVQDGLDGEDWLEAQSGLGVLDGLDVQDGLAVQNGLDGQDGLGDLDGQDGGDGQYGLKGQNKIDELYVLPELESQNIPRVGTCVGCIQPVTDPHKPEFETLVKTALKYLEKIEHEKFSMINIDEIGQQIVDGIKYFIDFRGVPTECGLNNEKTCPLSYCHTELVNRKWKNETIILCVECRSNKW